MAGDVVVISQQNLKLASASIFADLSLVKCVRVPVTVTDKPAADARTMTVLDNGDRILFGAPRAWC